MKQEPREYRSERNGPLEPTSLMSQLEEGAENIDGNQPVVKKIRTVKKVR